MQTTEQPVYPYRYAKKYADRVVTLLEPHCDIIHIAGSISRETMFCKDVEVVCLPKKLFEPTDLFGGGVWKVHPDFIQAIDQMKESVVKGKPDGRYMQIILKGGVKLDLFMPTVEDYYRQLAVRTGSADYSFKVIANAWTSLGWCGTSSGLRRRTDCIAKRDKVTNKITSWEVVNQEGEKPPCWQSEKEFFEWLRVKFIEPKHR